MKRVGEYEKEYFDNFYNNDYCLLYFDKGRWSRKREFSTYNYIGWTIPIYS